jgi:glc operon protein GlcG
LKAFSIHILVELAMTRFSLAAQLFMVSWIAVILGSSASAQDSPAPLVSEGRIDLNLRGAQVILDASQEKAREMKLAVNLAVVDDGGHLIAFARMDGARPASGYTAQTKAQAAATFRRATGPVPPSDEPNLLLNLSLQNAAAASGGRFTSLFGGVPVMLENQVIGAVGVGGGTGEQDAEIAQAGIAALIAELGEERGKKAP